MHIKKTPSIILLFIPVLISTTISAMNSNFEKNLKAAKKVAASKKTNKIYKKACISKNKRDSKEISINNTLKNIVDPEEIDLKIASINNKILIAKSYLILIKEKIFSTKKTKNIITILKSKISSIDSESSKLIEVVKRNEKLISSAEKEMNNL